MGKYINGRFVGPEEITDSKGEVYDVVYRRNPEKTKLKIIDWVSDKSSVSDFTIWGEYYDFDVAGQETIRAYVRDINSHRSQVKEFLSAFSVEDILNIKRSIPQHFNDRDMANNILKALDYKFKEVE